MRLHYSFTGCLEITDPTGRIREKVCARYLGKERSYDDELTIVEIDADAAGARLFGYPTFWINRQKLPPEAMGAVADRSGEALSQLVRSLA